MSEEKSYCKYCDRQVPSFRIVVKRETQIVNNRKVTYAWVGCVDCWDKLQRIT